MADDHSAYLNMFVEESRDHIQALNENLMALEESPSNLELVNSIFRSAHTLKGMAATMGFDQMAHLTHEMEDGLDKVRTGQLEVTSSLMDVLFRCVDLLENQLESIVQTGVEGQLDIDSVVRELAAVRAGEVLDAPAPTENPAPSNQDNNLLVYTESLIQEARNRGLEAYVVEVVLEPGCMMPGVRAYMVVHALEALGDIVKSEPDANQLEEGDFTGSFQLLMVTAEEPSAIESTVFSIMDIQTVKVHTETSWRSQRGSDSSVSESSRSDSRGSDSRGSDSKGSPESGTSAALESEPGASKTANSSASSSRTSKASAKSIRVDVERLDALMNLFSEFVIDKTRLEMISRSSKDPVLNETVQHLSRVGTDLQAIVMKMRMIPLETVFNRFPRMVRDLAKTLEKKVDFVVLGAETEMDRILVEDLADPLVHLLRNSLDHGLETPDERTKLGKNEVGKVQLFAYQAGNHVYIEIEDDGHGIDRARVLQKAVSQGLVSESKASELTDAQVFNLLFESGFSTAQTVTDISGRGVGLDAAKNIIVGLGGDLYVESTLGKGSKFTIQLPLTLSIMDAMLVKIGEETYAIPLNSILQIERITEKAVQNVHGKPMVPYRDRVIPLVDLRRKLGITEPYPDDKNLLLAVITKGEKWYAVRIDSVLGQQEIVLKSLGKYLQGSVDVVSGSTILGDGEVALILDPNAITR